MIVYALAVKQHELDGKIATNWHDKELSFLRQGKVVDSIKLCSLQVE